MSPQRHPHWKNTNTQLQYTLLLLLKTGDEIDTGTESKSMWGANAHSVVGLHQVKRKHNDSFCHCLYAQGANSLYTGSYSLEHLNTQLERELHMQELLQTHFTQEEPGILEILVTH